MRVDEFIRQRFSSQARQKKPNFAGGGRNYVYASGISPCPRAMTLDMAGGSGEDLSDEARERMMLGDEMERIIANRLGILPDLGDGVAIARVGEQEVVEVKDRDGTLLIRGKVDGKLRVSVSIGPETECSTNVTETIPYEIKSGQVVARARSVEDLERSPYGRKYVLQFCAYLLALNAPVGLLVLAQPGGPLPLMLRLEDHLEEVEDALRRIREAVDARLAGKLPDFPQDRSPCATCRHLGRTCHPSINFGEGATILEEGVDADVTELARTIESTAAAAREHETADRELKAILRGVNRVVFGGGRFVAEGKWQGRKVLDLPEDVKAKFTKLDEKGAFTLKVRRIAPDGEDD